LAKLELYEKMVATSPGVELKGASTRELRKYFQCSYAYVGSLKPKPTTRKPRN
jgi:hypothetical protein